MLLRVLAATVPVTSPPMAVPPAPAVQLPQAGATPTPPLTEHWPLATSAKRAKVVGAVGAEQIASGVGGQPVPP